MGRKRINIEYPLSVKSPNIIWGLISNTAGLQKWMADHVTQEGPVMTFTWGEEWTEQDIKTSHVLEVVNLKYIRLKWDYDHYDGEYWEMRIGESELTGNRTLLITDFADDDEEEYIKGLWSDNISRLHNVSGL